MKVGVGLFDKRQKTKKKKRGSNEQKQGNRKNKKDSRQLSCNSHCSFDRAMRVEETLMQTLACQLSSTLILVWSRLNALPMLAVTFLGEVWLRVDPDPIWPLLLSPHAST